MKLSNTILTLSSLTLTAGLLAGCGGRTASPESPTTTMAETTTATETSAVIPETTEAAVEETGAATYDHVLQRCLRILTAESTDSLPMEEEDPLTALYEVRSGKTPSEALTAVGYALKDLNGDGAAELLIGAVMDDDSAEIYANQIYSVYTMTEDGACPLFYGWSRCRHYMTVDGYFLEESSGGASYTLFGNFRVNDSATGLTWNDCYFTDQDTDGTIRIYRNQEGVWDIARSEEQEMTEDAFYSLIRTCEMYLEHVSLATFESYTLPISVCRLEDYPASADTCTWVTLDTSDYQTQVVLQAREDVTDLRVYQLSFEDVNEAGSAVFESVEVYRQDLMSASLPLGLTLTFPGDMPSYGISFVDDSGQLHRYAIGESGMDGSLYLTDAEF